MKIGIATKSSRQEIIELIKKIYSELERKGVEVFIDSNLEGRIEGKFAHVSEMKNFDLVLAVGGDGTILSVERRLSNGKVPILGINFGLVGFLAELAPSEFFKYIDKIIAKKFKIEERLKIEVNLNGRRLPDALNEVVVLTAQPAKMLPLALYIDDKPAEKIYADGIIIATPTGSTAYAMSAGGPIIDPRVDALVIVPICPFKLSIRPLVVPSNSKIKVKVAEPEKEAIVVIDGQVKKKISPSNEVVVTKSENKAYFARIKEKNFYEKISMLK